ncbi:MAG TPA: AmmeMemoRadiSam system protein B [Phycisphaerales bacterium]|nr:AmmeMemoRadiSam system protein B [Phycisphaerales bacterium]
MSDASPSQNPNQPAVAPFNASLPHHAKPRLRPVRGFPAKAGDRDILGLADARQISDKVVFTMPAAQFILQMLDGNRTIDEIVAAVGRGLTRPTVEQLVAQLDDAGLLFGPVFDQLVEKMKRDFDSSPNLPPASTAALADSLAQQELGEHASEAQKAEVGATKLRELMDQWIAQALEKVENPSLSALPKAIIAPHIDYPRGWLNYASVWGRLRVADRPDRVVVLGTNHFGESTGVTACDKGYISPLGTCEVDRDLVEKMRSKLGEPLYAGRYDHEREHSIELQIPWIQHVLGKDDAGNFCKVYGVMVHDPTVNAGESYDGKGVALDPFVEALKSSLAELGGRTLVVSSADLSHVGPAFGDRQPLAGEEGPGLEFRNKTFQHDQDMLNVLRQNRPDELVASMAWQQNPTRWCSIGNMVAAIKVTEPTSIDIVQYAAAMDEQGMGMVSSMAAIMQ